MNDQRAICEWPHCERLAVMWIGSKDKPSYLCEVHRPRHPSFDPDRKAKEWAEEVRQIVDDNPEPTRG